MELKKSGGGKGPSALRIKAQVGLIKGGRWEARERKIKDDSSNFGFSTRRIRLQFVEKARLKGSAVWVGADQESHSGHIKLEILY